MRSCSALIPGVGNSIILGEISSHCHQLKSSEGKEAPSAVFTPAEPFEIPGNGESRAQEHPGVDPSSLKTTIEGLILVQALPTTPL